MIDVLFYHGGKVGRVVILKVVGVVVGVLVAVPHVRVLVHYVHAQLVAGVEHALAQRIVRAAQRVEPPLLEQRHLAPARLGQIHCAKNAVVVVHASSAQLCWHAVNEQTIFAPAQRTYAKRNGRFVEQRAVLVAKNNMTGVEVGLFCRPQLRVGNTKANVVANAPGNGLAVFFDAHRNRSLADYARLDPYLGGLDAVGGYANAIAGDAVVLLNHQPDRSIYATARVPARVWLLGVVGNNRYAGGLPRLDVGGEVGNKARVAIRMARDLGFVNVHARVAHDSLELKEHHFVFPVGRYRELAFVLIRAAVKVGARIRRWRVGRATLGAHRVVRHAYRLPVERPFG